MRRLASLAVAIWAAWAGPVGGEELRACLRDADLPRATKVEERGFDVAVLRAVSAELGLELVPVWLPSQAPFTEIEGSDLPLEDLLRGTCDAVASVPGQMALGRFEGALVLTRPYYGAGFELVGADGTPSRITDLGDRAVGVRLQSLAHFAVQGLGLRWKARPTTAEVLALVDTGEVGAALVWGPALSSLGRGPLPGSEPHPALRFNEHIALRRADGRAQRIDAALERLLASGAIAAMGEAVGLVYHPPFEAVTSREALATLGIGATPR